MRCLTIDEIIAIESRVGDLLRRAREERSGAAQVVSLYRWYKRELSRLVGQRSPRDELRGEREYETAIKALCEALDC